MLASSLRRYDELANPIGIYRHADKGLIKIPPGAPDPNPETGLLELTKVARGGVRVAGGHIGSPEEVEEEAFKAARGAITKINAISNFGEANPQAAMKLL